MNRLRYVVLAVLCGMWFVGCQPRAEKPDRSTSSGADQTSLSAAALPSLSDTVEGDIRLADYEGDVVLLDFWATWCPPCRFELPALNRLHTEYQGRGFALIGMTVDRGDAAAIAAAVKDLGITYPVGLADEAVQAEYGGIRAVPTKFLIDRQGQIRQKYEGVVPEETLRAEIEALL